MLNPITFMKERRFKVIDMLSTLNAGEWKDFKNHMQGLHKESSDIAQLIRCLRKNKKQLVSINIGKEIRDQHFAQLPVKGFANLMSKLYQDFEEWIITYDLKQSVYDKKLALVKSFNSRGLYQYANKIANHLETTISTSTKLDLNKSRALYLLKDYQYYSDNPIKYKEGGKLLEDLVTNFNNFYKAYIHTYNAEMHNWGRIRQFDFGGLISSNSERINNIDHTAESDLTENLESLMGNQDLQAFQSLVNKLLNHEIQIGTNLHSICCSYAVYGCIYFIRNNTIKSIETIAEVYDYGLKSGGLLKEGKIPIIRFHNIITNLSNVLQYEKVNELIDKWIGYVDAKYPNSTQHIARAQNCLYHDRFVEILEHTKFTKFENLVQKLRVIRFEIIALYELQEFDLLDTTLQNYYRLVNRSKREVSRSTYTVARNFIKAINYLTRQNLTLLTHLYDSGEPLIFRSWIGKKLKR